MLFNSLAYLLLLSSVSLCRALTHRAALFMMIGSVIFYLFAGAFDTGVFATSVLLNWLICTYCKRDKIRIIVAVALNIGMLAFFKYINLFIDSAPHMSSYINIALPLGISFYTFQILAYHIDVVRHHTKEASSFKSFLLFVAFFPQLIAGPIVRSQELLPQIERLIQGKRKRIRLISYGLALFLLGLFKKAVIADSIAPFVDDIFHFGPEGAAWAWVGSLLFSFQIYCDFSGYSDMAIGSAYLLGIKLPTNFKTPYISTGPRDFWQRWHITLSTWIRDYLYIPLGGNKGSIAQTGLVVILTMAIAGLWHGADITFVIWGAAWGLYIFSARLCTLIRIPKGAAVLSHFSITVFLWVLFRAPNWDSALNYYEVMLGLKAGMPNPATFYEQRGLFPILLCTSIGLYLMHIAEYKIHTVRSIRLLKRINGPFIWGALSCAIILIIMLPRADINPFIYFRF